MKYEVTLAIASSYFISFLSFIEDVNWLGTLTALAGTFVTVVTGLKTYEEWQILRRKRKKDAESDDQQGEQTS